MSVLKTTLQNNCLRTGWLLLLASLLIFCAPFFIQVDQENYFALFVGNFIIAILYYFIIRFNKSENKEIYLIHYRFINLVLFLISAYALNRDLEVFSSSVKWFCVVLVIISLNYLSSVFFKSLPTWVQHLMFFIYGISLVVFIYLALYLMPIYAVSIFGLLAIGISIHSFVPGFFIYYTIMLADTLSANRKYWLSLGAGVLSTIAVCIIFVSSWSNNIRQLNKVYSMSMIEGDDKLPLWVQVAQKASNNNMAEKILKTDLIYTSGNWSENFLWNVPKRKFGEEQQLHDPLVIIANFFSDKLSMPEAERIKVLESQYNARHEALNRLWSGEHLKTQQVATQLRVWPEMHLAYTEKIITVCNGFKTWRNQEEAIYTLHMPEGAVVTSLSLWINGKEEKGILTSKQKADIAYQTIVGREMRDPSVVHWQEGNTVSIRVFPVIANECRTFKIGITAPLRKAEGQLAYDNIWFEGPDATDANELVKIEMVNSPKSFIQNASFKSSNNKIYTAERNYKPIWTLAFNDPGLKPHSFSFNGYSYRIIPYEKKRAEARITDVYLDINQSWTSKDFDEVWKIIQGKNIHIYNDGFQVVDASNNKEVFNSLSSQQFSLFPFHLIPDKEHSIVISKSGHYSPNLSDLEGSSFLKSLRNQAGKGERVRLFHLGNELSPYIRSLKEFRSFEFEYGNTTLLAKLFEHKSFVRDVESDNDVVIHSADIKIIRMPGESPSNAPDHLMRLFAYNHIMQKAGASQLTQTNNDSSLVDIAQEAYVVSPVSSLIVLETQKDYDRFDINDNGQSLKNASMKNNGAVPEPGEWAMIIIVAALFIFLLMKWKLF